MMTTTTTSQPDTLPADMHKYRNNLVRDWIGHLLRGGALREPFIEDKRRRDKTLRTLREHGYLDDGNNPTSKAFDEVQAVRPDLIDKVFLTNARPPKDMHDLDRVPGWTWLDLTPGEQKWVALHPADYEFFHFDTSWVDSRQVFAPSDPQLWCNMSRRPWVSDAPYRAELEDRKYSCRLQQVRGRNLAWGLKEQALIEPVDADAFAIRAGDDNLFGPHGSFGVDPTKWPAELDAEVTRCRQQIAALSREANVLLTTKAKIAEKGGWAAFLERYDAQLRERLERKGSGGDEDSK